MEDLTDSLLQMWDGRVGRSDLIVFFFFREAKPEHGHFGCQIIEIFAFRQIIFSAAQPKLLSTCICDLNNTTAFCCRTKMLYFVKVLIFFIDSPIHGTEFVVFIHFCMFETFDLHP